MPERGKSVDGGIDSHFKSHRCEIAAVLNKLFPVGLVKFDTGNLPFRTLLLVPTSQDFLELDYVKLRLFQSGHRAVCRYLDCCHKPNDVTIVQAGSGNPLAHGPPAIRMEVAFGLDNGMFCIREQPMELACETPVTDSRSDDGIIVHALVSVTVADMKGQPVTWAGDATAARPTEFYSRKQTEEMAYPRPQCQL